MRKIAYFDACVETPEEIIIATDMIPVRLFGNPLISIDKANEHVPPNHCVWARNILEQAINGLDVDIKGVITTHGCDCTNREFDIWLESVDYIKFLFFLNAPLKRDASALKFFIEDIKELILQLEENFRVDITTKKLQTAIKKMNQIRGLLRKISEYRSKMILSGSEFHSLVKQVQQNNKDDMLILLQEKLEELKKKKPNSNPLKKILLTGSVIDDTEFIKFLESIGFQVIIDDLCIGTKYFNNDINEAEEPLKAIAKYHLSKPIYSTKFPSYERFEVLKNLAKKYDVDGVINIAQKFCEPILYGHPYFNKKFKELEIPYLFIEMEYNRESYKQLATRFEAFAEII
ncbi:MAG: 2-hydroxyacyl-CoA dehydratase subunit D [Promethearchaeota archaeon]|jgi:benzoyl-CoA reductase/2-hydroxyglutaryl-CoA dehydratase subunit BcrC/BadD/HgdB